MKRALLVWLLIASLSCAWVFAQSAPLPELAPATDSSDGAPQSDSQKNKAAAVSVESSSAKARQLLDQMVAALGGDAWLTYKTLSQQGRSYSFYHGKPVSAGLPYRRFYQYPDKERHELPQQREMAYFNLGMGVPLPVPGGKPGDVVIVYNGDKGYEKTYKGTAAQDAKIVEEVVRRRRYSLEVVLREWLKDPATIFFYDGQKVADQQLVDVVTLLNKDNEQVSIGIDVHTHLPVSKRYIWRDPDKYKVEDETIYANYRKVQGIQTPYTITTTRDGEMTGQSFLSRAEYNAAFPPDYFDASVTYNPETSRPPKK
jgi:hypothetical protein